MNHGEMVAWFTSNVNAGYGEDTTIPIPMKLVRVTAEVLSRGKGATLEGNRVMKMLEREKADAYNEATYQVEVQKDLRKQLEIQSGKNVALVEQNAQLSDEVGYLLDAQKELRKRLVTASRRVKEHREKEKPTSDYLDQSYLDKLLMDELQAKKEECLRLKDELHRAQGIARMGTVEKCRMLHFQNCNECPDLLCTDNTSPGKNALTAALKEVESLAEKLREKCQQTA